MIRRLFWGSGLAIAATVVVVATVMVGIFLIDSPGLERRQRIDMQRVWDLDRLAEMIDCYWTLEIKLPADIRELVRGLEDHRGYKPLPFQCRAGNTSDPETGEPYPYRVLGDQSFELCANFSTSSEMKTIPGQPYYPSRPRREWRHSAGRVCFSLSASTVKDLE